MTPKYVVDASLLLRREEQEEYEEEAYPTHWSNFDKFVDLGVIVSVDEVKDEITEHTGGFYEKWAEDHEFMFNPTSREVAVCLSKLSEKYPVWYSSIHKKNKHTADASLIAFAKVNGLTLITQESYKDYEKTKEKNFSIPTVWELIGGRCIMKSCSTDYTGKDCFGDCINFNELIKRERLFDPDLFEDTMNDV